MTSLHYIELHHLVKELTNSIVGSKVNQIYHFETKQYALELYSPQTQKRYFLYLFPGQSLFVHPKKIFQAAPHHFSQFLKKILLNCTLSQLSLYEEDRIIQIQFTYKTSTYLLYVELFPKGTILLTDTHNMILNIAQQVVTGQRILTKGKPYTTLAHNTPHAQDDTLYIITSLVHKGLGKDYATKLLTTFNITPTTPLSQLSTKQKNDLEQEIQQLYNQTPQVAIINNTLDIFAPKAQFNSINDALIACHTTHYTPEPQKTKKDAKITKNEKIRKNQQQHITKLTQEIETLQKQITYLHEHQHSIQALLDLCSQSSLREDIKPFISFKNKTIAIPELSILTELLNKK